MSGKAVVLVLLSISAAGCSAVDQSTRRLSRQVLLGGTAQVHEGTRREVVRIRDEEGAYTVHTPPRVRPVEVSDAEFQSSILTAALHWPMNLDPGRAVVRAPGGEASADRLRPALWYPGQWSPLEGNTFANLYSRRAGLLLASGDVGLPEQRSLLEGYAQHCERRRSPGDCYRLLDDAPTLDAADVRRIALRIALAQALQLAFETVSSISAEDIKNALVVAIYGYLIMWLIPEPISKLAALAFTAAMVAYVGTDVFWALREGFAELKADLEAAKTFDEVSAAGDRLGRRLGPSIAKVIVMVASFAVGGVLSKVPLPKLTGGPGALANANSQGLVLSGLQSITVVPGSLTFAVTGTSASGLVLMAATLPGGGPTSAPRSVDLDALADQKAGDLISGSLKRSKSYASELADRTVAQLRELAKGRGAEANKASKMLKLIKEGERLRQKNK